MNKTEKKILTFVQDALKHGHRYEPVASRKYEIMQYKMKRNIFLRETGLNIQSLLFWLDVSPEGLIYDKEYSDDPGLLEIKCPSNRRNSSPADLLSDHSFYLQQNKHGEFCFKKIIILIIIPKFKWQWDYSKLIIVILWYSSLNAWSKRGLNLITYLHDNKYFEKLILKSNFKLTSILLQTWMLEAVSLLQKS